MTILDVILIQTLNNNLNIHYFIYIIRISLFIPIPEWFYCIYSPAVRHLKSIWINFHRIWTAEHTKGSIFAHSRANSTYPRNRKANLRLKKNVQKEKRKMVSIALRSPFRMKLIIGIQTQTTQNVCGGDCWLHANKYRQKCICKLASYDCLSLRLGERRVTTKGSADEIPCWWIVDCKELRSKRRPDMLALVCVFKMVRACIVREREKIDKR